MTKQQRITPGAILEILIGEKFYYAQILLSGNCAFFDLESSEKLEDFTVLENSQVLFILAVYDDVITGGRWRIVETMELRGALKVEPFKFIQDALDPDSFELYDPNSGDIREATREECEGLECSAVWEAEHIEDRIVDHYKGRPNIWVEQLKIK